VGEGGS